MSSKIKKKMKYTKYVAYNIKRVCLFFNTGHIWKGKWEKSVCVCGGGGASRAFCLKNLRTHTHTHTLDKEFLLFLAGFYRVRKRDHHGWDYRSY